MAVDRENGEANFHLSLLPAAKLKRSSIEPSRTGGLSTFSGTPVDRQSAYGFNYARLSTL